MSLNISELLNPSPPSPAPPPLPSSEDTTSSSANTNTQASTIQTSPNSYESQSQPPNESGTAAMSSPEPSRPPGKPNSQLPRYKTVAALTDQGKDFTPLAREENKPPGRRTKQPPVPKRIATPKARTPHGAPPAAFPVEPSPPLEHTSTSPTLEHYHLPSGPAEIKRRQSFAAPRTSPPPVLAPIQSPTQSVTSPTTTAGHEGKNAEGYVNNGYTGTDKLSSEGGGAYIEDGLVAKKGVSGVKTREDTTTKGHGHSSSATHAHTEQAAKVKKETNDVTLDSLPPIKTEESVIPIATTEEGPTSSIPTVKKVAALKRDNSRASSTEMSSPTRSTSITKGTASAPSGAGTKRKAPTSGRKIEKKGIAKPSTAKKRKLDDDAASSARRTGSPASSRASKTPAPKTTTKVTQAASVASSPPAEDEDEKMEDDESIDENEVFCICRKPDDHSYMIACDGGCDDWFHGKCVGVLEKHGDLIDKYICPNCKEMDRGQTTWKAMCRLDECNKPARVTGKNVSKFCSDEHGREFMAQSLRRSGIAVATDGPSPAKKRRKSNWTDHDSNEDSEYNGEDKNDKDYEDEEESRGGVLKAGELKAAVNSVKSAEEFRKLGEGVLSRAQPKNNTLENGINGNVTSSASIKDEDIAFTKPEHKTLKDIELSRTLLSDRRARLADREKFLSAVRHRGKAALEHLKAKDKSFKDICGFDPRLSWSDDHFDAFRSSAEGVKVLVRDEALGCPATTKWVESGVDAMNIDPALDNPNVNPKATGNANAGANVTTTDPETDGACLAKRCVQHTQWIRIFGDGIREEVRLLKAEEAAMDREEKGVKQRAMLRMLEGKN